MKTTMIKKQTLSMSYQNNDSMINAREASHTLCLPYYWFSNRTVRAEKRLPHYCLGNAIRFRVSELVVWANQIATSVRKDEQ